MKIRVMIVDDHKIIRDGLKAIMSRDDVIDVAAEAEDGRKAVRLAAELKPDVVVIDLGLPEMNGVEATRRITAEHPGIKVLVLTMYSDKKLVMDALNAGASGYLLKDCGFEELLAAVKIIAGGDTYLTPRISSVVINGVKNPAPSSETELSAREREILQLLAEGKNTKHIAYELEVSIKTVEAFRQRLMRKLNISTIAELTRYAIKEGFTFLS